jgi:hypothetical protein
MTEDDAVKPATPIVVTTPRKIRRSERKMSYGPALRPREGRPPKSSGNGCERRNRNDPQMPLEAARRPRVGGGRRTDAIS